MKGPLIIQGHMGLGDHLITNGLVRVKAEEHESVYVPCKAHNLPSVAFMWSDVPNIHVIPVKGDLGAQQVCSGFDGERLGLGMFGKWWTTEFQRKNWDQQMYEQAGVPFKERWERFSFPPAKDTFFSKDHCFIHEDRHRGFSIDGSRLGCEAGGFYPAPEHASNIFVFSGPLRESSQIHCIDSSFAILADSIPTKAKRHVLHLYARPNAKPPTYRKPWEILR